MTIKVSATEFINEARKWLKTPYHHQESVNQVGCDCAGFPKGVMRDSFGIDVGEVPINYGRLSQPEILLEFLRNCNLVKECPESIIRPGRIILTLVQKEPQHFGIITYNGYWIHADAKYGVVETPAGKYFTRMHSVWIPVILDESLYE